MPLAPSAALNRMGSVTDLKPGAVGLAGAVMQNITHIAPAIAAFFFTQTLVSFAGGQAPLAYEGVDPVQQVRDHVWVSPYYEDNLPVLRDELGANRMIFGSDYPHAEGLADPLSFVNDLPGFSDEDIRLVMRENALALSIPRA